VAFFFFSSRRRHTRFSRDWSSDVCSSDLAERAASLCMARGNWEVDLEHLFLALMEQPRSDLALVVRRSGIAPGRLEQDLSAEIDRFRTGNTRTPVFSQHLPTPFEHAWLLASLDAGNTRIRSGHLTMALPTPTELSQL